MIKNIKKEKFFWILYLIFLPFLVCFNFPIFNFSNDYVGFLSIFLDNETNTIMGININSLNIYLILLFIVLFISLTLRYSKNNKNIFNLLNILLLIAYFILPYNILTIFIFIYILMFVNKSYLSLFIYTFSLNILGMLSRFILEYGEVSNKLNFTIKNILIQLIFLPLLVILILIFIKKLNKNNICKK